MSDPIPESFQTRKEREEFYRLMLSTKPAWAIRALEILAQHQTREEQITERTIESNGVGFNGLDAEILTSFYAQVCRWKSSPATQQRYPSPLTTRQLTTLFRLIPKYTGQLLGHLDRVGKSIPVIQRKTG